MDDDSLGEALAAAMADAPTPAVGVSVETRARTVFRHVTGTANLMTGEPVTLEHWWDLASLTKVLLTSTEMLDQIVRGAVTLDTELAEVVQGAARSRWATTPLWTFMSHGSGLPSERRLYLDGHSERAAIIAAILQTPPGDTAVYSDLNYILLGEALTAVSGCSLTELADRRGFCRAARQLPRGPRPGYVATEECPWRGRLIQGEVHDENAAALGGIAGHAGGFATLPMAGDAARAWLTGHRLPDGARDLAARLWSHNGPEQFGLGFFLGATRGVGGAHPGPGAFGATGFVGNRLWVEPARGYAVVVLSNRVHPQRSDRAPFDRWSNHLVDLVGRGFIEAGQNFDERPVT